MLSFIKKYKVEIAIFLLAVLVRLAYFFVRLSANSGDMIATIHGADGYFELSQNLLLGNGFSTRVTPPFEPYSYGVPGLPYFLYFCLLLTGSYAATSMIQLLLSSVIPFLGMYLARVLLPHSFEYKHVPLAVGVLTALSPFTFLQATFFSSEALFTAMFLIFLILFIKFMGMPSFRLIALSGMFLGFATLVKPNVQYLPVLVIGFTLWRFRGAWQKELLLKLGCFLFAFLLVLSPWLYRNYKTFHMKGLSSQSPMILYTWLLPSVLTIEHHSNIVEEQAKLLPIPDDPTYGKSGKFAMAEIMRHPIALLNLSLLSAFTFFTHDGMLTLLTYAGVVPSAHIYSPGLLLFFHSPTQFAMVMWGYLHTNLALVLVVRVFWMGMTLCFGLGLYRLFLRRLFSVPVVFAVSMVFYFMLTTMIVGLATTSRFRMPVEPIIFTVACVGFIPIYRQCKEVKKKFVA